jgi:hypothetical protein
MVTLEIFMASLFSAHIGAPEGAALGVSLATAYFKNLKLVGTSWAGWKFRCWFIGKIKEKY